MNSALSPLLTQSSSISYPHGLSVAAFAAEAVAITAAREGKFPCWISCINGGLRNPKIHSVLRVLQVILVPSQVLLCEISCSHKNVLSKLRCSARQCPCVNNRRHKTLRRVFRLAPALPSTRRRPGTLTRLPRSPPAAPCPLSASHPASAPSEPADPFSR